MIIFYPWLDAPPPQGLVTHYYASEDGEAVDVDSMVLT